MKKATAILLCAALFTACAAEIPTETAPQTTIPYEDISHDTTLSSQTEVTEPVPEKPRTFPKTDGSTSTIPLEAGLRAAYLGIPQSEAEAQVEHTKTHTAFARLMADEVELILTVPITPEQAAEAESAQAQLVQTPVAVEGFVFLVNSANPVDSLTQEQLRGIYSGDITNWAEVGGNDAPITPFQRNEDSGSQSFMKSFMGEVPLIEPQKDYIIGGMGGLVDSVASYDYGVNSIGYSVYQFAANMYGAGLDVKFIAVDGVEPSSESFADESYPLCSYTLAIHKKSRADELEGFMQWLMGDEGVSAVREAGYVPVGSVQEAVFHAYTAVGTGAEKPETFTANYYYTADEDMIFTVARQPSLYIENTLTPDIYGDSIYDFQLTMTGLADKEIEARINTVIAAMQDNMNRQVAEVQYNPTSIYYGDQNIVAPYGIRDLTIKNGYLSVCFSAQLMVGASPRYYAQAAVFDLYTGDKLDFSDLFFAGESFTPFVNEALAHYWQNTYNYDMYGFAQLKRDFAGLESGFGIFTLDEVFFGAGSVYSERGAFIKYGKTPELSAELVQRDMAGLFADESLVRREINTMYSESATVLDSGMTLYQFDKYTGMPSELIEKANSILQKYADREMWYEDYRDSYIKAYSQYGDQTPEELEAGILEEHLRVSGTLYGDYFMSVSIGSYMLHSTTYYIDLKTGEDLDIYSYLEDGWREAAIVYDTSGRTEIPSTLEGAEDYEIYNFHDTSLGAFWLFLKRPDSLYADVRVEIPREYFAFAIDN